MNANLLYKVHIFSIIKKVAVFILVLSFSACENDLKEVERVSSQKIEDPVDVSYGVKVLYSDSAVVKAQLTTPKMLHFNTENPYYEFPQGGLLIMYDSTRSETQRVKSDYAIQRVNTGITELRKNVVATRADGMTLKSEELIWDENEKRFYSNLPVTIIINNQVSYGTSFWAKEDFSYFEITSQTGNFEFSGPKRF
ncbi:LPS export ABC transporter periplasmic protein LptC [Albibacterium bauzanense]|uniref:LPS export ABC transporter protein LptC n=1 Tax=Albibacterium bauzanense TaxID=653929 RepID=A0A4R1M155_9SPHI|nr:LPS export ABC transporter periplasmic protein LptC [Albibacterium bauzanense]TCK83269.1 LPS export ABC transporter protein LptC [Albibacterium bauzanense]